MAVKKRSKKVSTDLATKAPSASKSVNRQSWTEVEIVAHGPDGSERAVSTHMRCEWMKKVQAGEELPESVFVDGTADSIDFDGLV